MTGTFKASSPSRGGGFKAAPTPPDLMAMWDVYIHSDKGGQYIARRVGAASRALLKERLRLEDWFESRPR